MYLACIALVLLLGKYFNHLRVLNETLRLQNKFTQLNSRLYSIAELNDISPENAQFKYLNHSLSTAEKILPTINFWSIVYMAFKQRKAAQPSYLEFEKSFMNTEMRKILNEYTKESYKYFYKKNFFAIWTFFFGMTGIVLFTRLFNKARGITFKHNFKRNFKFLLIKEEYNSRACYSSNNNRPVSARQNRAIA